MKQLQELIASHEDWLLERVLYYARERNYIVNIAALERAWRLCICTLSAALLTALRARDEMPHLGPDDDYSQDPIVAFFMFEAQTHRERGVHLGVFLSFLKYYRQVYIDLIRQAALERDQEDQSRVFVEKFFDHLEIGFFTQWVKMAEGQLVTDSQLAERDECLAMVEELRASEARFRSMVESAPLGQQSLDEEGRLLEVNQAWLEFCGYQREEVIGRNFGDFLRPSCLDDFARRFSTFKQQGEVRGVEFEMVRKDQSLVTVSFHGRIDRDEHGRFTQAHCIFHDVTERNQATEALHAREARLRSAFQYAAIGMAIVGTDGRLLQVNSSLCGLLGYSQEELVTSSIQALSHPEDVQCSMALLERMLSGAVHSVQVEKRYLHKSGEVLWVLVSSSLVSDTRDVPLYFITQFQDITQRKRAEQARALLAAATEQSPVSVSMIDLDGVIRYVNPAYERNRGFKRAEVEGRNFRAFRDNCCGDAVYHKMWETVRSGEIWSDYLSEKAGDGSLREIETTISPIRDQAGAVIHYVAAQRDVTHERQMERQLRQAQKMEAVGTLAGGIAHDFNNILAAIIGYTEMLLVKVPKESPIRRNLEQVLKAGNRAKGLVKQILAFSRQSEQELKPIQIGLVIKEALKLLRASLPTTIEIRSNIGSKTGTILADPTQIHQVLMNLCTNAAHAMRTGGGVLEVSLAEVHFDGERAEHYPDASPGPYLKLTVGDTGCGMDRLVMARMFDPFFSTKGPGEGAGMGLAMVHGIVRSHGGVIAAASEPGQGAIFDVFFPRLADDVAPTAKALSSVPRGSETILFVDDEATLVDMTRQILEQLGYRVVPRTSSREALEAFRAHPEKFDLVITDQTMPQLTGVDLAQEILALRPGIPIILCTGFSEMISPEKAKAMGVREFVLKPIITREIAVTIRKALEA
jgi:PAS domain S-box-containing protein